MVNYSISELKANLLISDLWYINALGIYCTCTNIFWRISIKEWDRMPKAVEVLFLVVFLKEECLMKTYKELKLLSNFIASQNCVWLYFCEIYLNHNSFAPTLEMSSNPQ
jgi:hypothetical protein